MYNNRIPLTEICNDGERMLLIKRERNYYYLTLPIKPKYQSTIELSSTHNPPSNLYPNTMTKMFHSKPLLVKGLQKSSDLGKNGFFATLYNRSITSQNTSIVIPNSSFGSARTPYSSVLTLPYTEIPQRVHPL